MNRQMMIVGVILLFLGAALQAILVGSNGFELDPLGSLFGLASFIGLILIIAGALRSDGARSGPQQQQQVVVYAGAPGDPAPAAPRYSLRCPTCKTLNEASAQYCMECGHRIPTPRAGSPDPPAQRKRSSGRRRA